MINDRKLPTANWKLLNYNNVQLGQVELNQEPAVEQVAELKELLLQNGFELLDDKKIPPGRTN